MKVNFTVSVDEAILKKFQAAISLEDEIEDDVVELLMRRHIAHVFQSTAADVLIKADRKIPRWSERPDKKPHRIIAAYWQALKQSEDADMVSLDTMRKLCGDKEHYPALYVSKFDENYAQMKLDAHKSYGKVFEDDGGYVRIWDKVRDTMERYRDKFIHY